MIYTITDGDNNGTTWEYYYNEIYDRDGQDDWLITPAISVIPGKMYDVSVKMRARSAEMPPSFEIRWGTSPDPQAMTNVIIAPTSVTSESATLYSGVMAIAQESKVYVGLRNIDAGYGSLATDLTIGEPIDVETPGAVSNLTATSDNPDELKAIISFTTPDKNMDGGNLSGLTKIVVTRGEETVQTFENPAMAQQLSCTDNTMTEPGEYTYTVTPYNVGGAGLPANVKIYVGPNIPAAPVWARVTETSTNGEVTIEWDVPTTYADGRPLDPATLTFNVYTPINGQDIKILSNLTGSSHTFQAMLPEEQLPQYMFYFCVTSQNAVGENFNPAVTDMIPLGNPYIAPYEDSFPNLSPMYLYGQGTEEYYTFWDYASDTTYPGIQTYDHDNGMFALKANEAGYASYLFTGKISLENLTKPALTFYVHNNTEDKDNTLEVSINDRSGFKTVDTWTMAQTGGNGWNRITIPLDQYKGKDIQVKFTGRTVSSCRLLLDNLRIVDRYDNDLAISKADIPAYIKAGNSYDVTIDYVNEGLNDSQPFTIDYMVDGQLAESRKIAALKSDGKGSETFTISRNANSPANTDISFAIRCENDQKTTNNMAQGSVETYFPEYPAVTDLKATYNSDDDNTIYLNWSAPDMSKEVVDKVVETFEDAEDWADSVDDWTFYDEDHGGIYGFGSWVTIPGIDVLSQHSWWVVNGDYAPLKDHFAPELSTAAHSGSKYITSMSVLVNETEARSDDWAVSPELTGKPQTITFWARSFFDTDLESFELLVSSTGTEISDFTSLQSEKNVPYEWTRYTINIPEGTRYFAIRSRSRDCYMLMVDDIDFAPKTMGYDLEHIGYNVYRDGVMVNDAPVMTEQYVIDDDSHSHNYNVTALYKNRGESALSNTVIPVYSSVEENIAAKVSVSTAAGTIFVKGADNMTVNVYAIDGTTVASVISDGETTVNVAPGIYIVTVGRYTYKVTVK